MGAYYPAEIVSPPHVSPLPATHLPLLAGSSGLPTVLATWATPLVQRVDQALKRFTNVQSLPPRVSRNHRTGRPANRRRRAFPALQETPEPI